MTSSGLLLKCNDRTMVYLQDYQVAGLGEAHIHLTAIPFLENCFPPSHTLSGGQQGDCHKGNAICDSSFSF